jgi:serine/threonine protein kinase/tetratricopeptide (TPR) repeat protein
LVVEDLVLGRFRILERIGSGGMGTVYRALDERLRREVAVKEIPARNSDRVVREAKAAARLNHPAVVALYEFGIEGDSAILVSELAAGDPLDHLVSVGGLTDRDVAEAGLDVCEALAHAHDRGVIHRDVKPANLMIDGDGMLRILDFGIARVADSSMTQDGRIMGTPNYMSPEQVEGRPVDRRSDIFAVGLVLYELLSYRQAFSGDSSQQVMNAIAVTTPAPLNELSPDLDPGLVAIVARAIEKDASRRFQTMSEMATQLARIRHRLREATDDTTIVAPPGRTPSRLTPIRATPRSTDRELLSRRRRELIEAHLAAARLAFEAGDYSTAIERAQDAAMIDPDDPRIIALLESAHVSLETRQWLDEARERLSHNDMSGALALVDRVEDVAPDLPEARSVRESIKSAQEELLQRQQREKLAREEAERLRVRSLAVERAEREIAEAESLIAGQQFDEALAWLKQIESVHEVASTLEAIRVRAQAGANRVAEAARQASELRRTIDEAESALVTGRIEDAVASFAIAKRIDPRDPRLPALQAKIGAERDKALAQRDEEAAKQVAHARSLASAGRIEDALASLQTVPSHPRIAPAIAEIRERRSLAERVESERQRKAAELVEWLQKAQRLIEQRGFDEALRAVDAAAALGADTTAVADLRKKAEAGVAAERSRAEHDRRAVDAIARALKLFGEGRQDAAFAELEAVTPEHRAVTRTIKELRAEALARDQRAAVDRHIVEARSWFTDGKTTEALNLLDALRAQGEETPTARTLRAEIVAADASARERATRRRRVEEQFAAARTHIDREHYDDAFAALEHCRAGISPGHPAEDLANDIERSLSLVRTRRDAKHLLEEARTLLRAGQPQEASASLERAVLLHPTSAGAPELRAEINAALETVVAARTREEAARGAVARAREAERRGELTAAAIVLANAVAHPLVQIEKARIDQAIQRERERQKTLERQRDREKSHRIGQLVKAAKKAMKTDPGRAMHLLDAALQEDPGLAEVRELRRETISVVFGRIERLITDGSLDAASAALEEAARIATDDVRIAPLKNRLMQARAVAPSRPLTIERQIRTAEGTDSEKTSSSDAGRSSRKRSTVFVALGTAIALAATLATVGTKWYVRRASEGSRVAATGPEVNPAGGQPLPQGADRGTTVSPPVSGAEPSSNAPNVKSPVRATTDPPANSGTRTGSPTRGLSGERGPSGERGSDVTNDPSRPESRPVDAGNDSRPSSPVAPPPPALPDPVGTSAGPLPGAITAPLAVIPDAPASAAHAAEPQPPVLDRGTASQVLTQFFELYGAFDIAALSAIFPDAQKVDGQRIAVMRRDFKNCAYDFRITELNITSSSTAIVQASVSEKCVPKVRTSYTVLPRIQVFYLRRSGNGAWSVANHSS